MIGAAWTSPGEIPQSFEGWEAEIEHILKGNKNSANNDGHIHTSNPKE